MGKNKVSWRCLGRCLDVLDGSLRRRPGRYAARPDGATRLAVISDVFDLWVWLTPSIVYRLVEERAPVRIGIPDPIVAIEVQRARIVAIVRIAEQFGTTQTAPGSSTSFLFWKASAKVHIYFVSASQRARI